MYGFSELATVYPPKNGDSTLRAMPACHHVSSLAKLAEHSSDQKREPIFEPRYLQAGNQFD